MTQPFQFPNGQAANNAEDLVKICEQSPNDCIYHLNREDFEKWLEYIGETKLAEAAKLARLAPVSDEQRLEQFLASFNTETAPSVNGNGKSSDNSDNNSASSNPIASFFKKLFAGT